MAALAALGHTSAFAQPAPAPQVLARAIAGPPKAQVVAWVAENAEPTRYSQKARPDLAGLTYRQIMEAHCGSVQPGYAEALAKLNRLNSVDPDARPGAAAYTIQWPACLHVVVRTANPIRYAIKPQDTLTSIRRRFTGAGGYDVGALNRFYSLSNISVADAHALQPGAELSIPTVTSATILIPKTNSADFAAGLASVAGSTVTSTPDPPAPGDVIGPVTFGVTLGNHGPFEDCVGAADGDPYPYDPAEVEHAYKRTRDATPTSVSQVSLVIIDNGFFGVPCGAECPEMEADLPKDSPEFPRTYFAPDLYPATRGYGPQLSGSNIQPLNYWNTRADGHAFTSADVDADAGHGTHVAGLSLGGPAFIGERQAFLGADGKPWLRLVIGNIANGQRKLLPGSDRNLAQLLRQVDGARIVNMSIAFNGKADPLMATTIRDAITQNSSALIVAAAGNQGGNLAASALEAYPARFGGSRGALHNVITVASVDGRKDGVAALSEFSNRGAAYVDIAAPGCKLRSWTKADGPATISGTSQAAPIVAFAATLLQSMWQTSPDRLRNRILYSGDLLDRDVDRKAVWSESRLNIPKALAYQWDRMTYARGGVRRTLLGRISVVQKLQCDDTGEVSSDGLRAFKRAPDGKLVIYSVATDQSLTVCRGSDGGASPTFTPLLEIVGGRIVPLSGPMEADITIQEIQEVVRAR